MKNLLYLIVILALSSGWSCTRHRNCCVMPEPPAAVTAQKNGVGWDGRYASGTLSQLDTLSISAISATIPTPGVLNKVDTLNIKIAYTTPGTYTLTGNQAFYGVFKDGGITGYQMNDTYHNVIVITGYQRISNPYGSQPDQIKITGTFNIMFIDPNNPAGISFQQGNFYAFVPYL